MEEGRKRTGRPVSRPGIMALEVRLRLERKNLFLVIEPAKSFCLDGKDPRL